MKKVLVYVGLVALLISTAVICLNARQRLIKAYGRESESGFRAGVIFTITGDVAVLEEGAIDVTTSYTDRDGTKRNGAIVTVLRDSQTIYERIPTDSADGQTRSASPQDVRKDSMLCVIAVCTRPDQLKALRVLILPANSHTAQETGKEPPPAIENVTGLVTDMKLDLITLQLSDGSIVEARISSQTKCRKVPTDPNAGPGSIALSEIQKGMRVTIAGDRNDDGTLNARGVLVY